MATKEEIKNLMDGMVAKLNEVGPYVSDDWGGSVQFIFPDLKTGWLLKLTMEGSVEFCEERVDEDFADGIIEFNSDILVGIMNKSINPQEVKADGRMKLRKSLDALGKIMLPATSS